MILTTSTPPIPFHLTTAMKKGPNEDIQDALNENQGRQKMARNSSANQQQLLLENNISTGDARSQLLRSMNSSSTDTYGYQANAPPNASIAGLVVKNTSALGMHGHLAQDDVPSVNSHEISVGLKRKQPSSPPNQNAFSDVISGVSRNVHNNFSARKSGDHLSMMSESNLPSLPQFLQKQNHVQESAEDRSQRDHETLSRLINDQRMCLLNNIVDQPYLQHRKLGLSRMHHSPPNLEEQITLRGNNSSFASTNLLAYQNALLGNAPAFSTARAPYSDINIRPPSARNEIDPATLAAAYLFVQQQQERQQQLENVKRRRTVNDALLSLASIPSPYNPAEMENRLASRSYTTGARMHQQEELLARYAQPGGLYSGQDQQPNYFVQLANNIKTSNQPHRDLGIGGSSAFASRNPYLQQHGIKPLAADATATGVMGTIAPTISIVGPHLSIQQSSNDESKKLERQEHRKLMTLKTDSDVVWLSKFLCFLRAECCEVHKATAQDVKERRKSKQVKINQVGIRCRFCSHLPHYERAGRSSCFPSSIDRIYQSVTMMIREHFSICEEFPHEIRQQYVNLKKNTKKGEMESKSHWKSAAEELGMVNIDHPKSKGIFFVKDLTPDQLELLNS